MDTDGRRIFHFDEITRVILGEEDRWEEVLHGTGSSLCE